MLNQVVLVHLDWENTGKQDYIKLVGFEQLAVLYRRTTI
jgi:hypothetical protein